MSETFDVHIANLVTGPYTGAPELALFHVPTNGGGITVLEAIAYQNNTGTATTVVSGTLLAGKVVTFGTVGTSLTANGTVPTLNGTVGSFYGTIITGAGTVHHATISSAYVAPGYFIGVKGTAGTLAAGLNVQIAYVMGK
jgi:hypothetical protein